MRRAAVMCVVLLGVMSFSCKDDAVTPPVEPPGRQHDIPWPSLADSPWPMHHGNPQSTGRSRYVGPQLGQVVWSIGVPGVLTTGAFTSLAIGSDSTIYVGSSYEPYSDGQQAYLYALKHDGIVKWKLRLADDSVRAGASYVDSSPLLAANGTIFIATPEGIVYAVGPDGKVKWKYRVGVAVINVSMSMGLDGTLYFVAGDFFLYALEQDGNLKWKVTADGGFNWSNPNGIAISPDGRSIYVAGLPSVSKTLYAVGIDGRLQWTFDTGGYVGTTPLVDSQGNIYIGPSALDGDSTRAGVFSLRPDGTVRWRYGNKGLTFNEPTMDFSGNLYLTQDNSHLLTSLDYDGNLRWIALLPGVGASNSLVCDMQGTVYVSSAGQLVAISNDGRAIWNVSLGEPSWNSAALGVQGSMYMSTVGLEKRIHAFR